MDSYRSYTLRYEICRVSFTRRGVLDGYPVRKFESGKVEFNESQNWTIKRRLKDRLWPAYELSKGHSNATPSRPNDTTKKISVMHTKYRPKAIIITFF